MEESLTPLRVLPTPEAIGDDLAARILERIAGSTRRRFLLGCPTGRTPAPIYAAMARQRPDLRSVVLVMMDEYLVRGDRGFEYARVRSCHEYVATHIAAPLAVPDEAIWFPDPNDPEAYDVRIADAGGIDFFLLASGAGDGHVAFNPPGSPRDSRTRVVELSEQTRRDNLQTFPAFGSLEHVPRHGVSVGIDTIARAREAVMVVWGASKRLTLSRIKSATAYEPAWPATVIHECARREIVCDAEASESPRGEH